MKFFFFLGTFFLSVANAATIINLGPDFEAFIKSSKNADQATIEKNWTEFEDKHKVLYKEIVIRNHDSNWRTAKIAELWSEMPKIEQGMLEMFKKADEIVADQEQRFKNYFPDLPSDIPVIFMVSMFTFNGKVSKVSSYGKMPLLIGVDMAVQRKNPLNVLFSHEYFHAYHFGKMDLSANSQTMAGPLWTEGLATYVSSVINPHESEESLLMNRDLAVACADRLKVKQMAKEYLEVLDTDGEHSYADWFTMGGKTQPARRGYCLGVNVIREIIKGHSLEEIVIWNEPTFSDKIAKALKKISQ